MADIAGMTIPDLMASPLAWRSLGKPVASTRSSRT
jgi:hypothetical protein